MPPAARTGDITAYPGIMAGPGATTVIIAGLPAAVVGDSQASTLPPPTTMPPTPCPSGSATVIIEGRPALRIGDVSVSGAPILTGALNVIIGG
jgi:uncharacterized Zn-binding protein involved in type VI secretion